MPATTTIVEKDTTGRKVQSYILSTQIDPGDKSNRSTRLDVVPREKLIDSYSTSNPGYWPRLVSLPLQILSDWLLPLFLPHGYPHTVTPDYTSYQIYDSLQAFASSIAGLLSARAVLQSLGFDDDTASSTSTATFATLLSIAQATVSNVGTILFAHYASQRISRDVKFYRFLADIVNDAAFLIDCLSPSLSSSLRIPALCCSSLLRAVCGVAGGSSKAVLSSHFAINGNVGELNAKDGSQETVIGLFGMWVGGLVVSRVSSISATWRWVLGLLALHLWFNYQAVRCVRLRGLNGYRAGKVLSRLYASGKCPEVDAVGREEGVFNRNDVLTGSKKQFLGTVAVGVSVTRFIKLLGGRQNHRSGSWTATHTAFQQCIEVMRGQRYLLWFDMHARQAFILLKEDATVDDELKAWYHAIGLASVLSSGSPPTDEHMLEMLSETLLATNDKWPTCHEMIIAAGWDMTMSGTEAKPGTRMSMSQST